MEQTIITGIMRAIGNTMIGIDGDTEMDGEKIFRESKTTAKNGRHRGMGEF